MEVQLPVVESCLRNQDAIYHALRPLIPERTTVLELGSGTGQHGVYIANHLPNIRWQLSDLPECLPAMRAWAQTAIHGNVLEPLNLDVNSNTRPNEAQAEFVFTANTIHFVSFETATNLIHCAARSTSNSARFAVYGPFNDGDYYTSEGNRRLDEWLKERDPSSGIKSQQWLIAACEKHGFIHDDIIQMPANNLIFTFTRQ